MPPPTVHILLATYNGGRFLVEQLRSITAQTHANWTLTVSDDGSTDNTLDIVTQFTERVGQQVTVLNGPCLGSSTRNFFHLIQHAQVKDPSDLFAFCDQDDVWLEDKLERAVAWHANNIDRPVRLYCGRTQIVNEQLKPIGLSPGIKRPPSFGNALVQNIASGNTMVMNQGLILAQKKVNPEHSVWHDWTTYLIATSLGGVVCFDEKPILLYRQHRQNVLGANTRLNQTAIAFLKSSRGRYRERIDANLNAVADLSECVTERSRVIASQLQDIRTSNSIINKLHRWHTSPIRRQTWSSNLALMLAVCSRQL